MKQTGTYVDVIFDKEGTKLLNSIIKSFGLTKDFTDAYHCTIAYSKKPIPDFNTSEGDSQDDSGNARSKISKTITIKGFGHFDTPEGKNLHVEWNSPYCKAEAQRALDEGGTTDYSEYKAHSTLMYNCKDFTYSKEIGKEFIGKEVQIIEERIQPLNEDWVEDSKKEEKKEKKPMTASVKKSLITEARASGNRVPPKKKEEVQKPKKIDDKIVIDTFKNKSNKKLSLN